MNADSINKMIESKELIYRRKLLSSGTVWISDKTGLYILSTNVKPCIICNNPTNRVDIYCEAHICNDEKCNEEFYNRLAKAESTEEDVL